MCYNSQSMIKKFKPKLIAFFVSLIVIVVAIYVVGLFRNGNYETYTVLKNDFILTTNVSGKVVPGQEINLSFETPGKVSVINAKIGDEVKEGDILARLNSTQIDSEIEESLANLESQQAKLDEISGNDELQSKLESSRKSLISILKKSYVSSDDIIRNTVDAFFTDPASSAPEFSMALADYFTRKDIEQKRVEIEKLLVSWEDEVVDLDSDKVSLSIAEKFVANLKNIEVLLSTISSGGSKFASGADKTQEQISAYRSNISQARTVVSSLIVEINSATDSVRSVEAEIPVLTASINSAQAVVSRLTAKSGDYVVRAPFDGIITSKDVELGVVVSSGQKVFSMIGKQPLEIESFVPEVNIAGVDLGDPAIVTFDAFNQDFRMDAIVSHIDPRETVKDGITTYRILFQFNEFNQKVLSGMNTEIEIEKDRFSDQIVIPRYLIKIKNGENYVTKLSLSKREDIKINLGDKDSKGNVVVISGLSAGDKIVVPN